MTEHQKTDSKKEILEQLKGWAPIVLLILPFFVIFSIVYNNSYFSTLNLTFSRIPMKWGDHVHTILEWVPGFVELTLFCFSIFVILEPKEPNECKSIFKRMSFSLIKWISFISIFLFLWIAIIRVEGNGVVFVYSIVGLIAMVCMVLVEKGLLKSYQKGVLRFFGLTFLFFLMSHIGGQESAITDYQKHPAADRIYLKDKKELQLKVSGLN